MFSLKLENDSHNIVDVDDEVKYSVVDCTGLNPPGALIYTSKSPNRKGVKYNGSSLNERHITISIKLLGDIETNRNELYAWANTESYIKIHYQNELKNVYCEGHVQVCDFGQFTDNEVVNLAIICEDPFWKDLNEISSEISSLLNEFTFPFAIDEEGISFSTVRDSNETNIFNDGTETGCEIAINCLSDVENLTIYDANDTTKQFKINTTLERDWIVKINTNSSPVTVKAYKPDGSEENLLKYVNNNPTWFTLKHGNNVFGYLAENGNSTCELSISFRNQYKGV